MIKTLKKYSIILLAMATLIAPALTPALASADNIQNCVSQGTNISNGPFTNGIGNGCTASSNQASANNSSLNNIVKDVVNLFSVVVGIVAVIMIIVGGFKYITSGGESGKIGSAKNTILFALVGIIVVALAQFVVHFVLNKALEVGNGTNATGSILAMLGNYLPF